MENLAYAPYNLYQSYGGNPQRPYYTKSKQQNWRQSKDGPYGSSTESGDYLDNYKRAQLKAILSQVNPNLTPRLQKANTREVGVQVNPRVDASVQCSLGTRTLGLPTLRDGFPQPVSPLCTPSKPKQAAAVLCSSGGDNAVCFTRPIAAFTPMSDRQLFTLPPRGKRGPLVAVSPQEKVVQEHVSSMEKENTEEQEPKETSNDGVTLEEEKLMEILEPQAEAGPPKVKAKESKRSNFQFLEQKYGYFHCKDCRSRWESAYVWCISGTNKVYFKQLCRRCQKTYNPYRVEAIQCQTCSKTRCTCPQKKRHIDLKRPHRQELCGRCKDKRLSCDNTYSFKYIM
ncbi:protein ZAR1-like [Microcaecilia unicolor]|uniref:ZAR1-like protein n=1 Tax=Microcaecilia unicolor TaxID=1415580 RepID=A0A6P7XXH0_9AMPH|nr:ZAR1-like protein [Microcaecilia unicolor]